MSIKMSSLKLVTPSSPLEMGGGWGQYIELDLERGEGGNMNKTSPVNISSNRIKYSMPKWYGNVDERYLEEGWMSEGVICNNDGREEVKININNNMMDDMMDDSIVQSAFSQFVYIGMCIADWVIGI